MEPCNKFQPAKRLTRDQMLMGMAIIASQRATCNRLEVGAVITHQNRVVSIGYNGAPTGKPHCDSNCNRENPCRNTIHAEDNAVSWARTFGTDLKGATMYVTHSPCLGCAAKIGSSGISRVVYNEEYRDDSGLKLLINYGVEVEQCHVGIAISVI